MQQSKLKRGLAMVLTASMMLGGSLTVFAEDATSGELTGTGTSNGHLDKKVVKVVLPTVTASTDTFNYTVDPEGLIDATSKDHAGASVTANADHVYFKQSDGSYASSSQLLDVENQSSVAIDLTVKAEVEENSNNIALANGADEVASAENALLYLGLKVGDATETVKTTGASKTVSIAGVEGNFEVKAKDGGGYEYAVKASPSAWQKTQIGLTGKCNNKNITATTTAPKVKVTWSWADPSANAAPSIATTTYSYTSGQAVTVPVDLGKGTLAATNISSVTFTNDTGAVTSLPTTRWSFSNSTLTFDASYNLAGKTRKHTITFNDAAGTTVDVTLQPAVTE